MVGLALVLAGCGRGPFYKFPEETVERCGAVDFLFVIDDSESMQAHQDNLRANFGGFIDGIGASLDDVADFHLGVVTSDPYRDNAEGCRHLGALVTSVDAGPGTAKTECGPYAEGNRYMTEEDDLEETFNCAAAVGVDGLSNEEPMDAMRNAIAGSGDWYSECNGDFIREDALLVTVIITDEEDGELHPGSTLPVRGPLDWFNTVVDTKGVESNAVVVSLLNGVTPECPSGDPNFVGANIANFTQRFTHGFVGGICRPDYSQIFDDAVDTIDAACSTYTTPFGE